MWAHDWIKNVCLSVQKQESLWSETFVSGGIEKWWDKTSAAGDGVNE